MQSPLGNTIPGNHPEVSQDSKLEPDESEEMSETTPRADLEILQGILGLREKADNKERWDNVVLVCVDCEAYENDPRKVTETGDDIDIGKLISKIQSSHIRISEYAHLRNKQFIKGDPKAFAFGKSTLLSLSAAKTFFIELFGQIGAAKGEPRNVILVGHALSNDVAYLRTLGFNASRAKNIVARMDTQNVATEKKNQPGLSMLLQALNIDVKREHLHNAGNDARYTLHALLSIAITEMRNPGQVGQKVLGLRAAITAARDEKRAAKRRRIADAKIDGAAAAGEPTAQGPPGGQP